MNMRMIRLRLQGVYVLVATLLLLALPSETPASGVQQGCGFRLLELGRKLRIGLTFLGGSFLDHFTYQADLFRRDGFEPQDDAMKLGWIWIGPTLQVGVPYTGIPSVLNGGRPRLPARVVALLMWARQPRFVIKSSRWWGLVPTAQHRGTWVESVILKTVESDDGGTYTVKGVVTFAGSTQGTDDFEVNGVPGWIVGRRSSQDEAGRLAASASAP